MDSKFGLGYIYIILLNIPLYHINTKFCLAVMYGLATYLVAAEGLDIRVNNTRKRDLIAKKRCHFSTPHLLSIDFEKGPWGLFYTVLATDELFLYDTL